MAVVVGLLVLVFRSERKPPAEPPAYAANLKFSDLKTSAAENFVGATVSYLDGTITNTGNQTVTHAVVEVTFKDDMGQTAPTRNTTDPCFRNGRVIRRSCRSSMSPLDPGQSKPFRLTFESISAQWNHAYPQLKVTQVLTR